MGRAGKTPLTSLTKIALLTTSLSLIAQSAWACSCPEAPSVAWSFGASDAVFIANIVSVKDTALGEGGCAGFHRARIVRLDVTEAWSGVRAGTETTLITGWGYGDCGYKFFGDQRYLIYATRYDTNTWTTNICTRTTSMSRGSADSVALAQLRRYHR
jgi:hypothetical protein